MHEELFRTEIIVEIGVIKSRKHRRDYLEMTRCALLGVGKF
jgi:hypothetical protein